MRTYNEHTKEWHGTGEVVPRQNELGNWVDEQGKPAQRPERRQYTEPAMPPVEPGTPEPYPPVQSYPDVETTRYSTTEPQNPEPPKSNKKEKP